MAVATRMPPRLTGEQLLAEGPDRSLGRSLDHAILVRAATTTGGATAAWMVGRATGTARRAGTIGLVALVGTQLGQTLVAGGLYPVVLAASIGSAAALVAVVQTPGVCQFFGCTPLGPVGWTIAAGSAAGATAVGALVPVAWRALRSAPSGDGQPQRDAGPAERRTIEIDGPARALGRLAGDVQAQA
jgi:hypothetical protein